MISRHLSKIQGLNLTGYLGTSQYNLQNLTIIDVSSNCIMSEITYVRPPWNTSASSTAVPCLGCHLHLLRLS
ncbi:hypothetical protein P8452_38121 [Trifolium repens]|nr:hypothetical protein P8452_38121 [Trifolium repens]